jgi:hypothetical protein
MSSPGGLIDNLLFYCLGRNIKEGGGYAAALFFYLSLQELYAFFINLLFAIFDAMVKNNFFDTHNCQNKYIKEEDPEVQ